MHKNKATVHELQQLCGFLNFLNRAIFPGRAFTRIMYSKFAGKFRYDVSPFNNGKKHVCRTKLKAYHHVRLEVEFRLDCEVWFSFLNQQLNSIVNRPMIDLASQPISVSDLGFYSDASANPNFGLDVSWDIIGLENNGNLILLGKFNQVLSTWSFLHFVQVS